MLTFTLQRESESISIGEANLTFSRSFEKNDVRVKCSNFIVAKLITTQKCTSITEHELAFVCAPEILVGLVALFFYALGIIKCESSVDRLYSLANEMQADKTLEDQAKSSVQEETKKELAKNPSQQNLFLTDSSSREERTTNLTQPNAAITGPPH